MSTTAESGYGADEVPACAGLLSNDSSCRVAACAKLGVGPLEAATPAFPLLIELLEDEVPAVRAAAADSIASLRERALPRVVDELVALGSLPNKMQAQVLGVYKAVGAGPLTIAAGFLGGAVGKPVNAERYRVVALCATTLPPPIAVGGLCRRIALRMFAVEFARSTGDSVRQSWLALAAAVTAGEETAGGAASIPEHSLRLIEPRLLECLRSENRSRMVLTCGLLSRLGGASPAVVPRLVELARVAPDVDVDDDRSVAGLFAARILATMAAFSPAASSELPGFPPVVVDELSLIGERTRGSLPWSHWMSVADQDRRSALAVSALRAGVVDERIVDTLILRLGRKPEGAKPGNGRIEAFEWGLRDSRAWAADALGRSHNPTSRVMASLDALFAESVERPVSRTLAAGALLRLGDSRPTVGSSLSRVAVGDDASLDGLDLNLRIGLQVAAMEALADAGGNIGASVGRRVVERIVERPSEFKSRGFPLLREAIRSLFSRPNQDSRAVGAEILPKLLAVELVQSGGDGGAADVLARQDDQEAEYLVRGAALSAMEALGAATKPELDLVRKLTQHSDVRLALRASRALRVLGK